MSDNDSWPKSAEAYKFGPVIGEGSTATVYEAVCIPRNERCAVKCINMEQEDASFMDEIAIEISAMARCDHPNVVQYYASFIVKEELWIVMRILDAGSVLQILKRKIKALGKERAKHGVLDETTVCTILRKTLKGLEYLHANGHVHRDIKAGNILLSQDGTLQIGDFGVSALLAASRGDNSRKKVCHTFVGTPCWMAPEVMEQENGYDFKADIWSLGILAVELATGYAPYFHHPPMKVVILTLRDDPPTLDTNAEEKDQYKAYGKTLRSFIADCLQKDPEQRPTATGLLKHPLMKKAKGEKYLVESLIDNISTVPPLRHSLVNKQPAPQVDDQNENWQFDFSGAVAASSNEESS